ncbi:MAG: 50S ribosomal protein L1 [Phycisphaeraceae bacterium]|nr:50S ribosomal protein L1 [Phycisphaeraceae bacterium]MCW5754496.1 50S ribosomal protein L1 [Phycisphaeraceae bacterium]
MPKNTRRRRENSKLVPSAALPLSEAVAALKQFKPAKFDQSVDICMHLGVDPKQADQMLRGSVSLPKGIGKTKRVVVFCPGDQTKACLDAGAVKAGGEDLVAEIEKGWMDFDVAVASPEMMRVISKLGRVLGPKGLMPSPKAGTVTKDLVTAVKEYSAGKVEYRTDAGGNVHAVVGKLSFPESDLVENAEYFIHAIERAKPAAAKGTYIKRITISGTMTPGIQIKHVEAAATAV